jgi:hypothetical protein
MKVVSEQELKAVQDMRNSLVEIITKIGELHLGKFLLENEIKQIEKSTTDEENKFVQIQEQERVLYESLQQKYGTGNINFDTGEIQE